MAEASTTVAAPMDEGKETEEMDNQELLSLLRADLSAAERRTDRRFDELKAEIKEVKQELKADIKDAKQEVTAYVDKRIDDGVNATNQRIDEVKQRIDDGAKATNQRIDEVRQRIDDGAKATNQRIDDLRDYIEANRLIKNNWRTFAVAALATAAVVGTFLLQLMEAIN